MKPSFLVGPGIVLLFTAACATESSTDDDASTDATPPVDAAHDTVDVAKTDGSNDAQPDVTDAADDTTMNDAAEDAVVDAPPDAPDMDASDGSILDGGFFDAGGKGCMGVFCVLGDTCCNLKTSTNYGKCEPTKCLACCM